MMAKASGTDLKGFALQLATTHIFATAADTYAFVTADGIVRSMDSVRKFSFEHGILGQSASSVDAVGIQFPAAKSLGDTRNLKLRFDSAYVKQAMDGTL
jgi:NitT/TauT family transport system substrate-binding protein